MASNAIEQRIEMIAEKWELAKANKAARLMRIQCMPDEVDMVDTFYHYMVAVDTPIYDIAFHFDTEFTEAETYSQGLVEELNELITIWNQSEKDERIDYVPVNWKPDYTLAKDKNTAAMFVANFNELSTTLNLPDGLFAIAIFKNTNKDKNFIKWLYKCIEYGIGKNVKFLMDDNTAQPVFDNLCRDCGKLAYTINLNLDMPNAMAQIAAMGSPNEPSTAYRQSFIAMMNAMEAQKEKEAEQHGNKCIELANNLLSKDPYWVAQIVVVYIALGNDKMRYKKKKEMLQYANSAVATAIAAQTYFDEKTNSPLIAQTMMFRGTIHYVDKNWQNAYDDYVQALQAYKLQGGFAIIIEASRMAAKAALKCGYNKDGMQILADAVRLGKSIDYETAMASTYRMVVDLLLQKLHEKYISLNEVIDICTNLFGKDWRKVVEGWKKIPTEQEIAQMELQNV